MKEFIQVEEMGIVIHTSYGGFHLSLDAIRWLAERGHPQAIIDLEEYNKTNDEWSVGWPDDYERHDKLLVEVVETLGKNASSDGYLEVVYINLGYYIDSYDGKEWIE